MHEDEGGLREKDGTVGKWTHAEQPVQENKIPDNVIRITRHNARGVETEHPAVFPVRLPAFIMQAYSAEGEIVYEPFCGSGTTIIAGEQTGRAVRAMELAPAYVDVAVRRWREILPNAPLALEGEGMSFEETAAARGINLTQESEAA
jgi:DNA modification methylase